MKSKFKRTAANVLCSSALVLLGATPIAAQACATADSIYLGSVCTVAFDFCPDGFLPAYGQELPINQYQALYSLLGIAFGGDGVTKFNLPDLRGRMAVGVNPSPLPGISVVRRGQKDGVESVQLNANNLPQHVHPATVTAGAVPGTLTLPVTGSVSGQTLSGSVTVNAINGDNPPSGGVNIPDATHNTVGKTGTSPNFYPQGTTKIAVPTTSTLAISGGTVAGTATAPATVAVSANATTNAAVANIPPRLGLTACIAYQGLYPTRP